MMTVIHTSSARSVLTVASTGVSCAFTNRILSFPSIETTFT